MVLLASLAIRVFLLRGLDRRRMLEEAEDSAQGRQTTTDQEEGTGMAEAEDVGGTSGSAKDGPAKGVEETGGGVHSMLNDLCINDTYGIPLNPTSY